MCHLAMTKIGYQAHFSMRRSFTLPLSKVFQKLNTRKSHGKITRARYLLLQQRRQTGIRVWGGGACPNVHRQH